MGARSPRHTHLVTLMVEQPLEGVDRGRALQFEKQNGPAGKQRPGPERGRTRLEDGARGRKQRKRAGARRHPQEWRPAPEPRWLDTRTVFITSALQKS